MTVSTLSTKEVLKELHQALTERDQLTTVPQDFELKLEEIQ
jgi:hypothetical protein